MIETKTKRHKQIRFFADNAGYATSLGRMVCAKQLADAETWAEAQGLAVQWTDDIDPDTSWMDKREIDELESGELLCLCAILTDEGNVTDSYDPRGYRDPVYACLSGITVYDDQNGRNYRRVIAAELANEARYDEAQILKGWAE